MSGACSYPMSEAAELLKFNGMDWHLHMGLFVAVVEACRRVAWLVLVLKVKSRRGSATRPLLLSAVAILTDVQVPVLVPKNNPRQRV